LRYRYESWVDFASRKIPSRVDLTPLVEKLNQRENELGTGPNWKFDDVASLTPEMCKLDTSGIPPEVWIEIVKEFLAHPTVEAKL